MTAAAVRHGHGGFPAGTCASALRPARRSPGRAGPIRSRL